MTTTIPNPQRNNPLHGITLKTIVTALVDFYGRERLGGILEFKCFTTNPSISSSLTFLRKSDRARIQVEELYLSRVENGDIPLAS